MTARNSAAGRTRNVCHVRDQALLAYARSEDVSPIAGGIVPRAVFCISSLLTVVTSALAVILLQDALPQGHGPEYAIFSLGSEIVAIGVTGAILPLGMSLLIVVIYAMQKRTSYSPFRKWPYWLTIAAASLLATVVFSVMHQLFGGVALPASGPFWSVIVGTLSGIGYWYLRGMRMSWLGGTSECFVLGSLSMFGSDIIRTFSGLASAPGEALVWGGGGFHDLVLWFGLYIVISYLVFRLYTPPFARLSKAMVHPALKEPTRKV